MPNTADVVKEGQAASTFETIGYAARSATSPLTPFSLTRRNPGPKDIQIEIHHCGVSHSDSHTADNE